ncbi:serine hydrolase domain-containing protein [Photobacterium rosenbergii]|uniref:serine hydrolase domain-containing protein n=1 Tax=Photobacterium rosenbergii TaxID=294936 RepID=UPI001C98ED66|nr:serine hydrolase domain-containing protein [Photobacterium rosenbergii]MBY5944493.1 beta-lactamase family protein [Photobacterium rosenbergii]
MVKHSLIALAIASTAATADISAETEQEYIADFSLQTFMYPSEQASWYWQNLDKVLPYATLTKGSQSKPLERNLITPENVHQTRFNDQSLGSLLTGSNPSINSMMIIQNGKVIFEHFNMPYDSQHVWMSNAKSIAGLLVALLEEEGKLDVVEPLSTYMPELADTSWGSTRIIDILNMQSGLDAEENDTARANPDSHITQLFFAEIEAKGDYYQTLIDIPRKSDAAKAFEYSSANTQILGLLIAKVEGKPLYQVMNERIWAKAGMSDYGYITLTPDGHEVIHGLMTSNTEDMARYAMLYTDSWQATSDERIISPSVVKTIQQSVTPGVYTVSPASEQFITMTADEPVGGSYQFDAIWDDGDMFKGGMRGQGIYISPAKDTVAVWFSNRIEKYNVAGFVRNFVKDLEK